MRNRRAIVSVEHWNSRPYCDLSPLINKGGENVSFSREDIYLMDVELFHFCGMRKFLSLTLAAKRIWFLLFYFYAVNSPYVSRRDQIIKAAELQSSLHVDR